MFERHDALEWGRLHPKKWNVRSDKFNHYCDIVDAFKKLMQEQALLEHLILEDLLPSKKTRKMMRILKMKIGSIKIDDLRSMFS